MTVSQSPQPITWSQPSHADVIRVITPTSADAESFSSYAVAARFIPANTVLSILHDAATPTPTVAYSSVQVSETQSIELNSDFLFCNHSCDPSVVFDMTPEHMEARSLRDIQKGEMITFFYPSTEWSMTQPFDCLCKSEKCIGRISGAKDIKKDVLDRYWLTEHIKRLKKKQEGGQ